jgi:hypothetical protein
MDESLHRFHTFEYSPQPNSLRRPRFLTLQLHGSVYQLQVDTLALRLVYFQRTISSGFSQFSKAW